MKWNPVGIAVAGFAALASAFAPAAAAQQEQPPQRDIPVPADAQRMDSSPAVADLARAHQEFRRAVTDTLRGLATRQDAGRQDTDRKGAGVLDPGSACVVSLGPTVVVAGLPCHGAGTRADVGATPPTPPAGEGGQRAAANGAAEDRALGKSALGANVLGVVVIADGTSASAAAPGSPGQQAGTGAPPSHGLDGMPAATKPLATRIPAGVYRVATNGDQVQLLAESGQVSATVPLVKTLQVGRNPDRDARTGDTAGAGSGGVAAEETGRHDATKRDVGTVDADPSAFENHFRWMEAFGSILCALDPIHQTIQH